MNEELPADMGNPIPDIAERVMYDGTPWRVVGWYSVVELEPVPLLDLEKGYRLKACKREEATVVELYAVCGALVRLDHPSLQRTGYYVGWSKETIDSHRESFLRREKQCLNCPPMTSRSYPELFERLLTPTQY